MNEDIILALSTYSMIKDGDMTYKQTLEAFKVLCSFPQWFTISEPIQRGTDFVYNIDIHLPEIK